jgi:hypothetical protein
MTSSFIDQGGHNISRSEESPFILSLSAEWAGLVGEKGVLKATTVHQELRVLRRMLNVAVRKKVLFANPCAGVEFPAKVGGLFRPHYVAWSEQ